MNDERPARQQELRLAELERQHSELRELVKAQAVALGIQSEMMQHLVKMAEAQGEFMKAVREILVQ